MLIKEPDSKADCIKKLEELRDRAPAGKKKLIDKEIAMMRKGAQGESEAAYLLDFSFKDHKNIALIHDLRLEINGRVAQIDHILIDRMLDVYVLETKNYNGGIKVDSDEQFYTWNHYKKAYQGIASPVAQNERHVAVLKDAIKTIPWPTRMGMTIMPSFHPCVLVSSNSRIVRPKNSDTANIMKADAFLSYWKSQVDNTGLRDYVKIGKIVSAETLRKAAEDIVSLHKPLQVDYEAKFGLGAKSAPTPAPSNVDEVKHKQVSAKKGFVCSKCSSDSLNIAPGKYGYYFKCLSCKGNTAINLLCPSCGSKEKIRKQKDRFFRECPKCERSNLFFQNKVTSATNARTARA